MAPTDDERWTEVDAARLGAEPWHVAYVDERPEELAAWVAELAARPGYDVDPRCVIATDARIVADRLRVGAHTTIASGCVIRGELAVGANCSLNAGTSTIGRVDVGDWVRIATGVVLVGENHVFDDPEQPIAVQGLRAQGVVVEDDAWLGANVTVVDGVTIGAHSVVAAGAVVTRDVAPWSVVGGVPARLIRRRPRATLGPGPGASSPTGARARHRRDSLERFDETVRGQWRDVLERCHLPEDLATSQTFPAVPGLGTYVDEPGASWHPRPLNDAVEIAGAFGATLDAPTDALVEHIQALQDPATGLFLVPGDEPHDPPLRPSHREWDLYGILSCGYALEVLGAGPKHPVGAVEVCDGEQTRRWLDALDWGWLAWPSGAWIDGFGTAAALNQRHHGSTHTHAALWAWLEERVHRDSGLWGHHLDDAPDGLGWLMAVNGYYRMTRGTYAQFGRPLPRPERAIDTVLAHARDNDWFDERERNACNVLDVVHPLWLLGQQTTYRRSEVRDGIARVLASAVEDWCDGAGFAWSVPGDVPGLQGTEMWLSIVFLAADLLGSSDGLSWRPRGVHRLEPIAH